MHYRLACTLLVAAGLSGCATVAPVTKTTTTTTTASKRAYLGTASVGDFLSITIDPNTLTMTYTDVSNGETGTVSYTVNADGSYALSDPNGNLIAAYELSGYGLLVQAAKTGPGMNTPALITAVESGPISMTTFVNNSYNYMQFRTASGGLEVGSVTIGATSGQNTSYWPYGALNPMEEETFHTGTLDFSGMKEDASGTFLSGPDGGGGSGNDYVFGTANGFFIVDTPNGSILGLQKAASKDFLATYAGTYNGIYYQKTGANTGVGNIETGTPSLGKATITVTATGDVTFTGPQGNVLTQGTLTPIADVSYLYGSAGELTDPCYGMFTFRATTASSQQDFFATFVGNAIVFSDFSATKPWSAANSTYNYQYGVGLK